MHEARLLSALRLAARRLQALENSTAAALGCGPGQARILALILQAPGVTAAAVQRHLGLDRATVSRAVRALAGRGLLRQEPRRFEGRCLGLHPTPAARALAPLPERRTAALAQLVAGGLSDGEIAVLDSLLRRVAANLAAGPGDSRDVR